MTAPAGVAPIGTTLTVTSADAPLSGRPAEVLDALGGGIDVSLGGLQPQRAVTLLFKLPQKPAPGTVPAVLSQPSDGGPAQLLTGTYDPAAGTLSTQVRHLSLKFPVSVDLGKVAGKAKELFTGTFGLSTSRPGCAGERLSANGVVVTLPDRYRGSGDGVVWPCLRQQGDELVVDLASTSGLPWRVRAAPQAKLDPVGELDVQKAAVLAGYDSFIHHRPYAEGVLVPTGSLSYRFPLQALPGRIELKLDLGTHLALTSVFAAKFLLEVFGVPGGSLLERAEVLTCIEDAVDAAGELGLGPSVGAVSSLLRATISCAGHVVKALGGVLTRIAEVVLSILGTGVAIVVAGLQGAWRSATSTDHVVIPLEVFRPQAPPGAQQQPPVRPTPTPSPKPSPNPAPRPSPGPAPTHSPVVHYDCPNDNSNIGKYVPPGRYWENPFVARGQWITGGSVGIGANVDGHDHRARIGIYRGSGRSSPVSEVVVPVTGYDGESFSLPNPIRVTAGERLFLAVSGIGDFTAYDNRSGCFIGRVEGYAS